MRSYQIAVLDGDGIGPEVISATVAVLSSASQWLETRQLSLELERFPVGLSALDTHETTLPDETFRAVVRCHGSILGPVMNHLYDLKQPGVVNPSRELRKRLDLFANVRPVRTYPGVGTRPDDIDIVVVRENTEGFYSDRNVIDGNGEIRPDVDTVISVRVVTRKASERVMRAAYRLARQRNRKLRVTTAHKANVLRLGCGLFLEARDTVSKEYADVASDDVHVDALAMKLVINPSEFDVIVTTNLFGDILSDLTAGLVGGLGLAPGLNVGTDIAVAQAVHGAAPDIAGKGTANPIAAVLSSAMLLGWLAEKHGEPDLQVVADDLHGAVEDSLLHVASRTSDVGGAATTASAGDSIAGFLQERLWMRRMHG